MQCLLTDNFSHDRALRLVRHRILIVKLWSVREIFENHVDHSVQVLCTQCRCRDDLREIVHFAICVNVFHDLLTVYRVHLINDQDYRCLHLFQLLDDMLLACPDEV